MKASHKEVKITCKVLEDGNKLQEINFNDGSQIKYITYTNGGKMEINGEEFDMPIGTVVETKSVNGRIFSKLIQTPDMPRKVINKPEYLDKAEQFLANNNLQKSSEDVTMPTRDYILNILGKAANKDFEKIYTMSGNNCKYEVCGSEMRVIDNNGDIKMIARYESKREALGLWIVSYDNGKPINGSHYASWNLDKPLYTVTYAYNNDNTVMITTCDEFGNKNTIKQVLPDGFCLNVDKGLRFVSPDNPHLGSIFE